MTTKCHKGAALSTLGLVLSAALLVVLGVAPATADDVTYSVNDGAGNCGWSDDIEESGKTGLLTTSDDHSQYICPANQVLCGRSHTGDENGNTKYFCCPVTASDGASIVRTSCEWSAEIRESNSNFTCASDEFMAGRYHQGDENGGTKYYCCGLEDQTAGITLIPDSDSCSNLGPQAESSSSFQCGDGQIMTARSHSGDENGNTSVTCCGMRTAY